MNVIIKPKLNKKQKDAIHDAVAEELRKQSEASIRRVYKLMCVVWNETDGHGRDRCMRKIDRISKLAAEHENDEVFWEHVDKRLAQMGIPFEPEDYEQMERDRNV